MRQKLTYFREIMSLGGSRQAPLRAGLIILDSRRKADWAEGLRFLSERLPLKMISIQGDDSEPTAIQAALARGDWPCLCLSTEPGRETVELLRGGKLREGQAFLVVGRREIIEQINNPDFYNYFGASVSI